jgi:predicted dinucleotide-binding enzyme
MNRKEIQSVGILGAGKLGVVLSQLATKAGYTVFVSSSQKHDELALTFSILAPDAQVVDRDTMIQHSDAIILAIPLSRYTTIPYKAFDDKLVIDAMNYWWEVDGPLDRIHTPEISSSEHVQRYFRNARIVKAFNHIGYHDLHDHASKKGDNMRRSIALASDYPDELSATAHLIDMLGFDPLPIGALRNGAALEPGSTAFGASVQLSELQALLKST